MTAILDRLRLHLALLHHVDVVDELAGADGLEGAIDLLASVAAGAAPPESFRPRLTRRLRDVALDDRASVELDRCAGHGVRLLARGGDDWPPALADLPHMPLVLFALGEPEAITRPSAGIVGTRRPTPYGIRQARRFAVELAGAGVTVVSGLARGVDGEAHRAALDAGGSTVAVLGSGLGRIYPPEHRHLAERILRRGGGAVVSEFPWSAAPRRHHFPQRNRILSGLSRAVVVVEAGQRSGSLHTVDWALRQGRAVFAVPGRVDQPEALGCLELIRSGATPAIEPADVIEAVLEGAPARRDRGPDGRVAGESGPTSDAFLESLRPLFSERDAWHPNELCDRLRCEPGTLLAELSRLESAGRIRRIIGGSFILLEDPRE